MSVDSVLPILLIASAVAAYFAGSIYLLYKIDELEEKTVFTSIIRIFAYILTAPFLTIYTITYTILLLVYSIFRGIRYFIRILISKFE